jgi:hypothetical protein
LIVAACKARAPEPAAPPLPPAPPQPTVLASDQPEPSAIVSDGTYLYWNSWGAPVIRRVAIAGGPVTTLYTGEGELGGRSIALGSDAIYFDQAFNIFKIPKAGGDAKVLGHVSQLPMRMTGDDSGAYFEDDEVGAFPAAGGLKSYGHFYETWDVAVDATHVYWIDRTGVARAPKAGGKVEQLAHGAFRFAKLALGDKDVYFGDGVLEAIFSVPKAGGKVRYVAHGWGIATQGFVVANGALWMIHMGALERVDPATGNMTGVAYGLSRGGAADHMYGVAAVGDALYIAAGGEESTVGGIQVIDLTGNPNAKPPPPMRYGGEILRVPAAPPADAVTTDESAPKIASVYFKDATVEMQDPGNAVRWIDEYEEGITPDVRAGKLGLVLAGRADRASAVEAAIRAKIGAGARIKVAAPKDPDVVGIELDRDDLSAAMTPR